ncbi:T9SS type A sorting domain-containing protein [Kordia sp.]|uniref:T9SS type A sorting domain-containing protein n=1 Tax=Kordia sp. TaxID=1965332 RepID=UPI0025C1B5A9|nr:T9SS type A sorting domain-containing protein [Kordia sp.]MCH2192719.1 T9SS type A sorting domain-containing protein [Kordia sp.]
MKKVTNILFAILLPYLCLGQLNIGGIPQTLAKNIDEESIVSVELQQLDMDEVDKEDIRNYENGKAPRFGVKRLVDIDFLESVKVKNFENGDRLTRIKIHSDKALTLNFLFDHYWLAPGAKLYIFRPDGKQVLGGFTSLNNKGSSSTDKRGFGTSLLQGDEAIMEFYEPASVKGESILNLQYVVHGYRMVANHFDEDGTGAFGASGDCQVNINCPEGDNWQTQKRGVALILVNGNVWCSGTLLNNVEGDCTPYFLTANHCTVDFGTAGTNLDFTSFLWGYESAGCNNGVNITAPCTNGAVIRANGAHTDFSLLELDENPVDAGINVVFNGWSRNAPGTGGALIHHPSGDIMKIGTIEVDFQVGTNGNPNPPPQPGNYWFINDWAATANGHSVPEGGSSGAGVFNNQGLLIAQHRRSSNQNCNNPNSEFGWFGRFDVSWNAINDPARSIQPWLDPNNTGTMTLASSQCIDCDTLVDFHFEHENEVEDTVFHICEDVYIDGAATDNTGTFFMDIWRVNGDGTVSWLSAQDPDSGLTSGWKYGSPDWVNVTETFVNDINHPVTFQAGVTYEVKIAISHPDCGWVSLTKRFTYTEGQMSSQFDIVDYNCHDGVFDVTVTAQDPAPNQWWRVYETDTQGATSDANTIGPVTGNQGGITTTFANLDPTKFYYIKHGVWTNNCPWQETRTPLTPDCCDEFNTADFSLGVDFDYNFWVGNYNGYEDLGATHEWYVLSSLNETGGPYTLVFSTTTTGGSNFPLFTNAQFGVYYTVVHKVVSYCGEICYVQVQYQEEGEALATENSAVAAEIDCSLIDEILNPKCEAPTNLQFDCRTATMSWLGDPSLTYVVEVTWDDPSCRSCEGTRPRVMRWETQGTSFSLPYIDGSGCFSWRVGTKCEDEIEWSASECVDCYTRPQEPTDVRTEAKISPNPNDGNMNIEISGADKTNFTIKVYRFDGILIKSFDANRIENKLTTISWNGKSVLTPGIYFFVITTDTEIITKKVIIK